MISSLYRTVSGDSRVRDGDLVTRVEDKERERGRGRCCPAGSEDGRKAYRQPRRLLKTGLSKRTNSSLKPQEELESANSVT